MAHNGMTTAGAYAIWCAYEDEYAGYAEQAVREHDYRDVVHWANAAIEAQANAIGFASFDHMWPMRGRMMPA